MNLLSLNDLNLEESALSILTGDELDIMREVEALNACGYREVDIAEMMAERWSQVLAIAKKLETEK